jgi:hypothetical protein
MRRCTTPYAISPARASSSSDALSRRLYGRSVAGELWALRRTVLMRGVFGPAEAALKLRSKGRGSTTCGPRARRC